MSDYNLSDLDREQRKKEILEKCRIDAGETFNMANHDPSWLGPAEFEILNEKTLKKKAKKYLERNIDALQDAQDLLYANDQYSLLLVFQAMDAAGKDGTIKHVISGVNPQGVEVYSFKKPSSEELDHNYLWRCTSKMPERGRIGIFNRSYYEEVLVVKVHPEYIGGQRIPHTVVNEEFWEQRYEDINNMEKHMVRNGTVILKFFLNVSKEEQKNRFIERLENPEKHWKFSEADLEERGYWDQYMEAFQTMINKTATEWAPWHVIPADNKWIMRAIVSTIVTDTILSLDMEYPKVSEKKKVVLAQALEQLRNE